MHSGVAQVIDTLGGCDAVVANAGVVDTIHRAERFSDEDWRKDLETNLSGAFYLVQAAFDALAASGDGRIVLISSVAAETAIPGQVAYGASKAGLVGMARTLAAEWASRGIRCNVVMPGFIATPKVRGMPPEVREAIVGQVPLRRGLASPTSSPARSPSCSRRRRPTSPGPCSASTEGSASRCASACPSRATPFVVGVTRQTGEEAEVHATIRKAIADHRIEETRCGAESPAARARREVLSATGSVRDWSVRTRWLARRAQMTTWIGRRVRGRRLESETR